MLDDSLSVRFGEYYYNMAVAQRRKRLGWTNGRLHSRLFDLVLRIMVRTLLSQACLNLCNMIGSCA